MRRLVIILIILTLAVCLIGYAVYHLFYMEQSDIPAPKVVRYSGDYWRGKYIFSFAQANSSMQEIIDHYLVVMDHNGKYLAYQNSFTRNFNYIYQLSSDEVYYYASPLGPMSPNSTITPEPTIWNMQTGENRTILEGVNIWGHHEFLIEDEYFVTLRMIMGRGLDTLVHLDPETGKETWKWSSVPYFKVSFPVSGSR